MWVLVQGLYILLYFVVCLFVFNALDIMHKCHTTSGTEVNRNGCYVGGRRFKLNEKKEHSN